MSFPRLQPIDNMIGNSINVYFILVVRLFGGGKKYNTCMFMHKILDMQFVMQKLNAKLN